jgi:hypothetical protein
MEKSGVPHSAPRPVNPKLLPLLLLLLLCFRGVLLFFFCPRIHHHNPPLTTSRPAPDLLPRRCLGEKRRPSLSLAGSRLDGEFTSAATL